ncbi:MAG TPA: nucleoid-associated protein [Cyclobacteriaceae bacterium]|nr:nucleoid-associated protein [Cyclobacteriaceae bacterium]
MTTLDFSSAELTKIITHHVGNKAREEDLSLSVELTEVADESKEVLIKHFVSSVNIDEWFSFDLSREGGNEVHAIASELFADPGKFIESSKQLSRLLYDQSNHPKIKEGQFNVVLFSNVILDNERMTVFGLFKSENAVPFIKMKQGRVNFSITHDSGFEVAGADKGCLIFNKEGEDGFKILIADRTNRSEEARYWRDDFLKVAPVRDEFHQTKQAISVTSGFLKDRLPEEFNINKADQIDLINRSLNYFKGNDTFNKNDFEQSVLQDNELIRSFRMFEQGFRNENNIESLDEFDISQQAVKRQTRFLKSVLKLDKNFHIYIHGNRELIQQGVESNGRKFYKIYFEKEA